MAVTKAGHQAHWTKPDYELYWAKTVSRVSSKWQILIRSRQGRFRETVRLVVGAGLNAEVMEAIAGHEMTITVVKPEDELRARSSLATKCLPAKLVVRRKGTAVHGATVHGATEFEKIFKHKGSKSTAKVDIDVAGLWPRAPPCSGACFVCLGDEGAMLMNVCDCKWLRVHPQCLESLMLTHQTGRCAVCTKSLQYEPRREKPHDNTLPMGLGYYGDISLVFFSACTILMGATLLGLGACNTSSSLVATVPGLFGFAGPLFMLQGTSTLLMLIALHLKGQLCGKPLDHWHSIIFLVGVWTMVGGVFFTV